MQTNWRSSQIHFQSFRTSWHLWWTCHNLSVFESIIKNCSLSYSTGDAKKSTQTSLQHICMNFKCISLLTSNMNPSKLLRCKVVKAQFWKFCESKYPKCFWKLTLALPLLWNKNRGGIIFCGCFTNWFARSASQSRLLGPSSQIDLTLGYPFEVSVLQNSKEKHCGCKCTKIRLKNLPSSTSYQKSKKSCIDFETVVL